jgi:hypothetical protein
VAQLPTGINEPVAATQAWLQDTRQLSADDRSDAEKLRQRRVVVDAASCRVQ